MREECSSNTKSSSNQAIREMTTYRGQIGTGYHSEYCCKEGFALYALSILGHIQIFGQHMRDIY
jgi:hypothetical protein